MGLIVFSDFHFHNFNEFSKPIVHNFYGKEIKITDRLLAQVKTIDKIFELANEKDSDILFCGDFYHARNKVETLVFNLGFKSVLENIKKYPSVSLYMVVGNHDQKDTTPFPEHSLEAFKAIPRVHVMDDFQPVETRSATIYPITYSDDTAFLKTKIREFAALAKDNPRVTVLAAHLGVDGSLTGKYSHRLEGAFALGDLFPNVFTYVPVGHYHRRQWLGDTTNTFYIGNTIPNTYSDEGQEKGVFYINVEQVEKPQFIPIKNKQFITLTSIDENTQEIVDNNYVRFILPKEQAQEVEIFKEATDNIRVEVQRNYAVETRIEIDRSSSEEQIVGAYADEFYPEAKQAALDILREVKAN